MNQESSMIYHPGVLYGVGVGPGDPELMTLKAVRLIRENQVIAVPGIHPTDSVAYRIAVQSVPELAEKELVPLSLPMVRDRVMLHSAHRECAGLLQSYLDRGQNVVCLTLGDPTVYSTFSYLQRLLEEDGYPVQVVSGVPSFCAAAARLGVPLAEWDEPLHIFPAAHTEQFRMEQNGNYVLMKCGSRMKNVKGYVKDSGRSVYAVENCGMPDEKLCRSVSEMPDEAGYFSLVIVKDATDRQMGK